MAARAYPIGWEYVLGLYAERRGLFMASLRMLTRAMLALRAWKRGRAPKPEASQVARP
jgi:hypothetical protein